MKLVALEGNIGVGKSTLLRSLDALGDEGVLVVQEPVDEWRAPVASAGGASVFGAYYADPARHAFLFQWFVCVSRVRALRSALRAYRDAHDGREPEIVIMERCIHADREVFMKHLREGGAISALEMHVYDDIVSFLLEHEGVLRPLNQALDAVVYLRASPQVAAQRVRARNRAAETGAVDLDFLRALHERHDRWLLRVADEHAPRSPQEATEATDSTEALRPLPQHVIVVPTDDDAPDAAIWARDVARDILSDLRARFAAT